MESPRNDDELEMNWSAEAVDASDNVSTDSEEEFRGSEGGGGAGAAPARQHDREDDFDVEQDVQMDADAAKKQKTEAVAIVIDAYTKRHGNRMTSLELADGHWWENINGKSKFVLTLLSKANSIKGIPGMARCECFVAKDKRRYKSPYFLILCSSALRCVAVIKHLTPFKCRVA
ncbi:hypothetical protein PR003_g12601 [Phytophthora rubi]|uniref:Uncharacterized protein n=1 Tax=Phytophthora rubi TaxID=129364 RepID=A0A6A3IA26_9STRA|nr:hypothetical protein PR001_g25272 [Phytophthora rubi]KAE8979302.1 hypothetical protein PR002_g24455 [Phytophthora rubi]KAE9336245.1 hypothetical protein PR003_g12601 [Phytophthora rubi]